MDYSSWGHKESDMTEQLTDRQTLFSGEIFSICGGAESNKEDQRKKKTSNTVWNDLTETLLV